MILYYNNINFSKGVITKTTIIISAIFLSIGYCRLPSYAIYLQKSFNVPKKIANNWSFAESTHNTQKVSSKNAYGRYQITYVCMVHFFDLIERNIKTIKNYKKYLLDDRNNCFIAYYMYDFWRGQGYNPREIMQIWLFGESGYKNQKRYSYSFENKIFRK